MKKKVIIIGVIIILSIIIGVIGTLIFININQETYTIKFKNLVALEELEKYENKKVQAIGFLSPISPVDGTFAYLMNMPFQTCPYCVVDDERITNTLAVFAEDGKKIEYTESVVMVVGKLKLEEYTDEFGYKYNVRLVDAHVEEITSEEIEEKIQIFNQLADKEILGVMLNNLNELDINIYYDAYTKRYGESFTSVETRKIINPESISNAITALRELNRTEYDSLLNLAIKMEALIKNTNDLIEKGQYDTLADYTQELNDCFGEMSTWMGEYEV